MSSELPRATRVAAYGLLRRDDEILMCRIAPHVEPVVGKWTIPGGGLDFGEDPIDGMIREVYEETGLHVECAGLAGVDALLHETPTKLYHSVRILYYAEITGGTLRNEVNGSTDLCQWWPKSELPSLPKVELANVAVQLAFEGKSQG